MMTTPAITIFCTVNCFDREKPKLPLSDHRMLELQWNLASSGEVEEISRWLREEDSREIDTPSPQMGETIIQWGHFSTRQFPLAKFRRLFSESNYDATLDRLRAEAPIDHTIRWVVTDHNYVEDENGNQISLLDMIECVFGRGWAPWDLEAVVGLGPSAMERPQEWTSESANAISQLISVTDQILQSRWLRSPARLTWRKSTETSELIATEFPSDEETRSVCALFRQLYSTYKLDNLLMRGCETYERFCSHPMKRAWIEQQKSQFAKFLSSQVFPGHFKVTRFDLLECFLYGCRVMHAQSKFNAEKQMSQLLRVYGDNVTLEVTLSFRQIAWIAYQSREVIAQDFSEWMREESLAKPDVPDLRKLLRSSSRV